MQAATRTQHWWFLRHAPVPLSTIYGRSDHAADISADIVQQHIKALAQNLPTPDIVLETPLQRTRQTRMAIEHAGWQHTAPIQQDHRLQEMDFGDWEGQTWDTIDAEAAALFWRAPYTTAPPNGESFAHMQARITQTLTTRHIPPDATTIVAFVHAGTIRAALCGTLGMPAESAHMIHIPPLGLLHLSCTHSAETSYWTLHGLYPPAGNMHAAIANK
jgi:broad specificity phosphatase PhoE